MVSIYSKLNQRKLSSSLTNKNNLTSRASIKRKPSYYYYLDLPRLNF